MTVLQDPANGFFLARWLGRWTWTAQKHKAHTFGTNKQAKLRMKMARMRFPALVAIPASDEQRPKK